MALPFSRNTTYAAGSQVKSVDLNAIQDAIVAQRNRSIGLSPASFLLNQSSANWTIDESGARMRTTTGAKQCVVDITPLLIAGDTIKEIVCRWQNGGTPTAGAVEFALLRAPMATFGTQVSIVTTVGLDTNTGGANAIRTSTLDAADHVVLADNYYGIYFEMDATAGGDNAGFGGVSLVLGA